MKHSYFERNNIDTLLKVTALLFSVIFCVLAFYSHTQDKMREEELIALAQKEQDKQNARKELEREQELDRQEKTANDSFYQKLADGFETNILIVGDSIGACAGASDASHQWTTFLGNKIKEKYNVRSRLTNVSMGGNTSYAGYVRTMALDDGIDYDLVIICYGQNDGSNNFGVYYESIIRAVKKNYPKASVICIQESSQRDYSDKMMTIQSIADHYGIPVVDTIAPFKTDYDSLSDDGVHPNDAGQLVYCEAIMNVIEQLVEESYGYDPEVVSAVNDLVTAFDSFQWYAVEQFKREGNTFILNTSISGNILGIDYNFTSGENSCKIYVDGEEYAAPEITFDYDFSQRHIMVVNNWIEGDTINVQNEIKVVFDDDENGTNQADGFKGLAISGK